MQKCYFAIFIVAIKSSNKEQAHGVGVCHMESKPWRPPQSASPPPSPAASSKGTLGTEALQAVVYRGRAQENASLQLTIERGSQATPHAWCL